MSKTSTAAARVSGPPSPSAVEAVIVRGDLGKLTEAERIAYYQQVCESCGLNPLTQPFGYLEFQGKLRLYALRACTDQLRKIHGVSVTSLQSHESEGILTITAHVRDATGREDEDFGCVVTAGLKGEALANARMKAVTKAKRRATLSLCGLGWLDESELDTLPEGRPVQAEVKPAEPARQIEDRSKKPAPAADNSPAKLRADVKVREAALVKAGVINDGQLLYQVDFFGSDQGFPDSLDSWNPAQIKACRAFLHDWVAKREKAHVQQQAEARAKELLETART